MQWTKCLGVYWDRGALLFCGGYVGWFHCGLVVGWKIMIQLTTLLSQMATKAATWGSFVDSKISRRALWEVYYPPFQGALDAGIWGKRVRLVGWCVRDRSELLGKTDRLDKMNFVPQFVFVGGFRAKPLPCRFGACIHIAMACRSQELCFQRVDLWNHLCHLTTFASHVAGCLSTMCAYNLVNGDMAKTDCQMPPLKSFLFGVGAGGFYKL